LPIDKNNANLNTLNTNTNMNNNTPHAGTFPLRITKNDDQFVVITNQGNHYASTHDPSAARLIAAAPDLLFALEGLMKRAVRDAEHYDPDGPIWDFISDASDAICKAKRGV
jgi:hypothetical protein